MCVVKRSVLLNAVLAGLLGGCGAPAGESRPQGAALSEPFAKVVDVGSEEVEPRAWRIEGVEGFGRGCSGTDGVVATIAPEGDAVSVELSGFRVSMTREDLAPTSYLSCTLAIALEVPPGYSYALTHIRYEGRSHLPAGMQASLTTSYGFQGSGSAPINIQHKLDVPSVFSHFDFPEELATTALGVRWSNCGERQLLNVNMAVNVQGAADRQDGWAELTHVTGLRFAWRRCASEP